MDSDFLISYRPAVKISLENLLYYSAERATISTRPRFLTLSDTFLIEGRSLSDRLKLAHVN